MTETETLFNGRWLNVRRRGGWEFVERANPQGAVIIVALTATDELLFVEQYRPPLQASTIEMPAGLIGDLAGSEHEDAVASAERELIEETGYAADRLEYVTGGPVSSGLSTEIAHFVRATGLRRVGEGGGDSSENIRVHHVPMRDAARWLCAKGAAGYPLDPKLWAGLYFAERNADGSAWR
ncbi:MAG: NUDIX hydrolase [Xanthomonadales bacterium]|nr:NUDIX hydrolase [Xanthomonadales bacterium]